MGLFDFIQRKREEKAQLNQIRDDAFQPKYNELRIKRAHEEGIRLAEKKAVPFSVRAKESLKTAAQGAIKATKEAKERRKSLETKTKFDTEPGPRGVFMQPTKNIFEGTGKDIWENDK